MNNQPPRVHFFQRKARSVGNYSVEFIFDDVRRRLQGRIEPIIIHSKYESSGLFKRLYNCLEAAFRQGPVNHITGDINYVGLLLRRRRTIHTILDCVFVASSAGLKRAVLKYFWLTVPVRRSAYITAISEATKQEILRYVSCDPDKIVVIPVAISERFTPVPKPFNRDCPVILQIGTAPNKNIPRLIEAIRGLPCSLHIVGKENPDYIRLLQENGIQYSYQWGLSEAEMLEKYREADILSLVSTYEGFGMPILEAQATGRPVITSNILSMPEVAGDAACLVDPLDPAAIRRGLERIISDEGYRQGLLERGFVNTRRFNPDFIAGQYLALYQKIYAAQG